MVAAVILLSACGAAPSSLADPAPSATNVFVSAGEALVDPVSAAIDAAVTARLGFPVEVLVRVDRGGDEQLVLYSMNALTYWLAARPDRATLTAAIAACNAESTDHGGPNCIDRALRDARRPELEADFIASCVIDDARLTPAEVQAECHDQFESTLVFDVEAYCDGAFWAIAQRSGSGWTTADAARVPGTCIARVLDAKAADLDADGTPEILLDVVQAHYDAMRLVNESDTRVLTVFRRVDRELQRTFSVPMGTYAVDLGPLEELRCNYRLEGEPRPSFRRECCQLPAEEDTSEEAIPEAANRFPVALADNCGPHWVELYAPAGLGGFGDCRVASIADGADRGRSCPGR